MSNQNYSAFSSRTQNKNKSKKLTFKSGSPGAEHDGSQKDTVTSWPAAPGPGRAKLPTAVPVVKTVVVCDGVTCGGNSHYK